ncbi:GL13785 [Drosophila persimilis]|uniref:GL13785 n=1 Tax=Drosophila persimilis TaxID=7234 RepID=B4GNZ6_DROPE|nr:putative uncharacterized protein DDB_G0290521 [Drosophila persimilis]EDW38879.1 GL13785 [Drosophila persimilis]
MDGEGYTRARRLEEFDYKDKLKLINAVQKRTAIWDVRNKKHFDGNALRSSWEAVASEMNRDVFTCKNAWKSLRDSYRYHMKLAGKGTVRRGSDEWDPLSDKSPKENDGVKWRFAPHMEFLYPSPQKRSTANISTVFVGELVKPDTTPSPQVKRNKQPSPSPQAKRSMPPSPSPQAKRSMQTRTSLPAIPAPTARPSPPPARPSPPPARPAPQVVHRSSAMPAPQTRPICAYWDSELNKLSPEDAEAVEQKMTRLLWAETQACRLNAYMKEEEDNVYTIE